MVCFCGPRNVREVDEGRVQVTLGWLLRALDSRGSGALGLEVWRAPRLVSPFFREKPQSDFAHSGQEILLKSLVFSHTCSMQFLSKQTSNLKDSCEVRTPLLSLIDGG